MAAHGLASETAVMAIVFGLPGKFSAGVVMLYDGPTMPVTGVCATPSIVYVTLHGDVPVSVPVSVAVLPVQTAVMALSVAVGRAITVRVGAGERVLLPG